MYYKQVLFQSFGRIVKKSDLHTSTSLYNSSSLVLSQIKNQVTTLTMNNPTKLNGMTGPMFERIFELFDEHAKDDNTKVLVLTGSGQYYSAGANLSGSVKPMHPRKLHANIADGNKKVFTHFLDFPKPILVATNGPAIGASVTSATLCDGIIASEKATFLTPFARLGITPEGCSSVHFERILGMEAAQKMLGQGWSVSAEEAKKIGLVLDVVPHNDLMPKAQELAEKWVAEERKRTIPGGGNVDEYKEVNAKESTQLADAFLSYKFLDAQYNFLKSKGKVQDARLFWILKTLHPVWSKMI